MRLSVASTVAALAATAVVALWNPSPSRAQSAPSPGGATATPTVPEPTPEAMKLASDIIAKTSQNRAASIQAMSAPLVGMMQQFGIKQPDRAKVLVDEVVTPMLTQHIDGLYTLQAKSYATTLSVDDLRAIDDFYSTPAGKDMIAQQPILARNLLANTTLWLRSLTPELQSRMQQAIKSHGWDSTQAEPSAPAAKP